MESTIAGGMGTAILALVAVIRILWIKLEEVRSEVKKKDEEILELHRQKVRELEAFKKMVEENYERRRKEGNRGSGGEGS
jgi:hypothetical protein